MLKLFVLALVAYLPASLSQECPEAMCMMYCEHGFEQDENGCDLCSCKPPPHEVYSDACQDVTCDNGLVCKTFSLTSSKHLVSRCVDPYIPNRCQLPMDVGPCKKSVEKWYYNTESSQCEKFLFGGCKGNDNRYDTETDCRLMCVPEIEPREPGECPTYKCEVCKSGYKQDQYGCDTCECADPTVDCPNFNCFMACEHGFVKDTRGCDACSCAPVPETYAEPCERQNQCMLYCKHGLKKDENGCDICECRDKPPCADIQCTMQCDFGFAKGWDGCNLCECAKSPCSVVNCPDEQYCKPELNGNFWEPTCIAFHETKPWCIGKPHCMIFCPHGFNTDQYGCASCSCLDGPPACLRMECAAEKPCPHGHKYDNNGCKTCECLPNPCEEKKCTDLGYDACEAMKIHKNCETCPASAKCLLWRNVRQVKIQLEYAHDPVEDHINFKNLHGILRKHVVDLMGVGKDDVKAFKVWEANGRTVVVEYYVISFGEKDIVKATKEFINEIENQELYTTYEETRFVPQQHTVSHEYYSKHSFPGEVYYDDEDTDSAQTAIIVAVALSLVVAAAVIVVVICVLTRTKRKNKGRSNKLIYKKVPHTNAPEVQSPEKKVPVDEVVTA